MNFSFPEHVVQSARELFEAFKTQKGNAKHENWVRRAALDSSGYVWQSKCGGFFAKYQLTTSRRPVKYSIPTKYLSRAFPHNGGVGYDDGWRYRFVVQPAADCSVPAQIKALDHLESVQNRAFFRRHDLHEDNVAMWAGQAVIIDW